MTIFITGKAYYAKVYQPEEPKNKNWSGRWKISVLVTDEEAAKQELAGLTIRPANDWIPGKHIEVLRYTTTAAGEPADAPKVVNADLEPITDMIGNGSDVNVSAYFNTSADSSMKHPRMDAVQVVNLIAVAGFEPRGVDAFSKVEGGYTGTSAPVENATDEGTPFEVVDTVGDVDLGTEPSALDDSRLV